MLLSQHTLLSLTYRIEVSILVVMDVALAERCGFAKVLFPRVSILVVMDVALAAGGYKIYNNRGKRSQSLL